MALFVTLIVLLILAGVSLSSLFSEKGLFGRAENAGNRYNEAKARETLETVLLTDGQYEKNTNPKYNQDDFLDDLIKKEIEGSEVKGDVAIIGEYAYELDRSVPKIGHYLGKVTELIFPTVTVAEITQADPEDNYRTAKIEITATIDEKASNGINRIEIWQNGVNVSTSTFNNEKTVTTEYRANRNGVYTIKAYSKISSTEIPNAEISGSARTTVEGIVPAVEFSPNGSIEWKKSHTTQITVRETAEKVTSMQYLWKKSSEDEPQAIEFTENCTNNSTITGQGETMTGKYKLWVAVTLGTGANQKTYISGSEEFYFDNEAPTVTLTSEPVSETSFTLTATASDNHSGVAKYEFYVDGEKKEPTTIEERKATYTWNGTGMVENKECFVVVNDVAGNKEEVHINDARTKLFAWKQHKLIIDGYYKEKLVKEVLREVGRFYDCLPTETPTYYYLMGYKSYSLDRTTGKFTLSEGNSKVGYYYPDSTFPRAITPYYAVAYGNGTNVSSNIYKYTAIERITNCSPGNVQVRAEWLSSEFVETGRRIGDYIGVIRRKDGNLYPDNGDYNGYWYVRIDNS